MKRRSTDAGTPLTDVKVIKVGTSAATRIAQACDRCRSKKIRCDGMRPSCTQCTNVGFVCRTSDKLSRRAFPRGYTESLEERVRQLETEVKDLKDLLDEKDEKLDLLSRVHSQSPSHSSHLPKPSPSSAAISENTPSSEISEPKGDTVKVRRPSVVVESAEDDGYLAGTSNCRSMIDAFRQRLAEIGQTIPDMDTNAFKVVSPTHAESEDAKGSAVGGHFAPRLVTDQMVNVFFQEWAPLFPLLYRPRFLQLYEKYTTNPEEVTDPADIAKLHLVFGVAALSRQTVSSVNAPPPLVEIAQVERQHIELFESEWRPALKSIVLDQTVPVLQCLVLAQIYCVQSADYGRLQSYRSLATGLLHRLGLLQSQRDFPGTPLSIELRKRLFWTQYTVDALAAAVLGLPRQLKDADIECEYPADADDEYITETGFQPTLPGESTKISSALALHRGTRVLSKVLDELYSPSTTQEIPVQRILALGDELDGWHDHLAPHLKLIFEQEKPSTRTVSSRSPLLSLMYHYTRLLIHRPLAFASLGPTSSSSRLTRAQSAKHIVQIFQLLEERDLSFSFCLNRNDLLTICGFSLLYQGLDVDQNGNLMKGHRKTLAVVATMLRKRGAPGADTFGRLVHAIISKDGEAHSQFLRPVLSRNGSTESQSSVVPPNASPKSMRKQLKRFASRFGYPIEDTFDTPQDSNTYRLAKSNIVPTTTSNYQHLRSQSQLSVASTRSAPADGSGQTKPPVSPTRTMVSTRPRNKHASRSPHATRPVSGSAKVKRASYQQSPSHVRSFSGSGTQPNLDYLAFDTDPPTAVGGSGSQVANNLLTDWERLLGSIDQSDHNIYDHMYGGPPMDFLSSVPSLGDGSQSNAAFSPSLDMDSSALKPRSISSDSMQSINSGTLHATHTLGGSFQFDGSQSHDPLSASADLSDATGWWPDLEQTLTSTSSTTSGVQLDPVTLEALHKPSNNLHSPQKTPAAAHVHSVLSFSDESLTSGEDFSVEWASGSGSSAEGSSLNDGFHPVATTRSSIHSNEVPKGVPHPRPGASAPTPHTAATEHDARGSSILRSRTATPNSANTPSSKPPPHNTDNDLMTDLGDLHDVLALDDGDELGFGFPNAAAARNGTD